MSVITRLYAFSRFLLRYDKKEGVAHRRNRLSSILYYVADLSDYVISKSHYGAILLHYPIFLRHYAATLLKIVCCRYVIARYPCYSKRQKNPRRERGL